MQLEYAPKIFKISVSNYIKIHPSCSMRTETDWQTEMMKLVVAFQNFVNAP